MSFHVIFGPGHAPGHVAFYIPENKLIINGDILFKGSYGRVDLPGGDFNQLKHTITQKLFTLPDDTLVYTGHGEETTIGEEKKNNQSEEHTSELQSRPHLVCRLLLEKKKHAKAARHIL